MIPTVTPETEEEHPDWYRLWSGQGAPAAPAPVVPAPKPLPTFHNRPRVYAKNLKDFEEK